MTLHPDNTYFYCTLKTINCFLQYISSVQNTLYIQQNIKGRGKRKQRYRGNNSISINTQQTKFSALLLISFLITWHLRDEKMQLTPVSLSGEQDPL